MQGVDKGQWAVPVVQPWHGHSILELDSLSSPAEGALLTKVMLIPRSCLYPRQLLQGGMYWYSLVLRCSRPQWGQSRGGFWG